MKLQTVRSGLVVGTIKGQSRLAFVFPSPQAKNIEVKDPTGFTASYDADTVEMSVGFILTAPFQVSYIPGHYFKPMDKPEYNHTASVMWGGSTPFIHEANASNAFGAHVTVSYEKYEEYGLKFEIDKSWKVNSLQDDPFNAMVSGTFPITSNEARAVKDRLRILVICELGNDPLGKGQGQGHGTATITEPIDTYVRFKLLSVEPKEFWVFDQGTGKIYLKSMILRASYPDQTHR